ncbi:hypothetical protein JX265_011215 [Neoarthrinium moseri]|uniref:Uncharacterized protein n=1 Tax=Neoarthrinium moseri TaxID=1658444 RepID=A0A9P9WD20_9PEZI|nr:uncharacterized protein JN550_010521 [Neoarthrinium moseri]KAI1857480.1 hypothetical protein JX265_011215 [Neoarthrinium moseri]KAI1862056.1 hypothetical protein JN550_010521 [Neoarthrinium moseri]
MCDETWPTCSACKRAERKCSGPPSYKFVINGCHSTSANKKEFPASFDANATIQDTRTVEPAESSFSSGRLTTIVKVQKKEASGGDSFHSVRLTPSNPRNEHVTKADLLSAKLLYYLEVSAGSECDLQMWGHSLKLLPRFLDGSAALRHAVDLLLTCWSNLQQKGSITDSLDLTLYNQALRSLQEALQGALVDPVSCLTSSTLAAQTVLQKVEIAFDHLKHDVLEGRESIFSEPSWTKALRNAVSAIGFQNPITGLIYNFWIEMTVWPTLVHLLARLHQSPSHSMLAMELALRSNSALEYLRQLDVEVFLKAMGTGEIRKTENRYRTNDKAWTGVDVFPTCYSFINYELANWFATHAFFTVAFSRMLQAAYSFLGHVDEVVEITAKAYSCRIWLAFPWMERRKPLELGVVPQLCLSFEGGNSIERRMVLSSLEEIKPSTAAFQWTEAAIVTQVLALTGRLQLIEGRS